MSTASLVVGVAAADAGRQDILLVGIAGLVAGALSMAAGEYVSVSSQADTERADLALERTQLATDSDGEEQELAAIYVRRGLEPALARIVAQQLMVDRDSPFGLVFRDAHVRLQSSQDDTEVVVLDERSGVLTCVPCRLTVQPMDFCR